MVQGGDVHCLPQPDASESAKLRLQVLELYMRRAWHHRASAVVATIPHDRRSELRDHRGAGESQSFPYLSTKDGCCLYRSGQLVRTDNFLSGLTEYHFSSLEDFSNHVFSMQGPNILMEETLVQFWEYVPAFLGFPCAQAGRFVKVTFTNTY